MPNTWDMESIIESVSSTDSKRRSDGLAALQDYLKQTPSDEVETGYLEPLMDALIPLLEDNNFKIVQSALACIDLVVMKCGEVMDVKQLEVAIPFIIEKMGDAKQPIRDKALDAIESMMTVMPPSQVFSKLEPGFQHKNAKIREQIPICFVRTIRNFGGTSLSLGMYTDKFIRCLEDSNNSVRDAVMQALEEIYVNVGDILKDVLKSRNIRGAQLNALVDRFSGLEVNEVLLPLFEEEQQPSSKSSSFNNSGKLKQALSSSQNSNRKSGEQLLAEHHAESKVKLVNVYSEKDLAKEMEAIGNILSNEKADWKPKCDSLVKLQGMIYAGAYQYDTFIPLVGKMKAHISSQLLNLRSALCKEACNAVAIMSIALQNSFDGLAEFFVPVLFKMIINTVNVISEAGANCARTVILNTRVDRIIPQILTSASSSQHNSLRIKCAEYLGHILSGNSPSNPDKFLDSIEETITTALSDAIPDVRQNARQCFGNFNRRYPERGQRLFESLSASVQKHLYEIYTQEERKSKANPLISNQNDVKKIKSTGYSSSSSNLSEAQSIATAPKSPFHGTFPTSKKQLTQITTAVQQVQSGIPKPSASRVSQAEKESASYPTAKRVQSAEPRESSTSSVAAPKRVQSTATTSTTTTTIKAKRVPLETKEPMKTKEEVANEKKKSTALEPAARRVLVPAKPTTSSQQEPEKPKRTLPEFDVHAVLDKASSSVWSTRIQCFQELKVLFTSERANEIVNHFEKVVNTCIQHLSDPHYKVVTQVLDSVRCLILSFPSYFEPYLERALPHIFRKTGDIKDTIKTVSMSVLSAIADSYEADTILLPLLLRVLDHTEAKLKIGALEFILQLMQVSQKFFKNTTYLKIFLQKSAPLLGDKNPTSKKAALNVHLELYVNYKEEFLSQVLLLPVNQQLDIRKALGSQIPDIDSELVSQNKVKKSYSSDQIASMDDEREVEEEAAEEADEEILERPQSQQNYYENQDDEMEFIAPAESPKVYRSMQEDHHQAWESNHREPLRQINNIPAHESHPQAFDNTHYNYSPFKSKPTSAESYMARHSPIAERTTPKRSQSSTNVPAASQRTTKGQLGDDGPKESLHNFIRLSRENNPSVWIQYFTEILLSVLDLMKHVDPSIRELAVLSLKELLKNQNGSQFLPHTETILFHVLESCVDESREVCQAASETLDQVSITLDAQKCVDILIPQITDTNKALKSSIQLLSKFLTRISASNLQRQLPIIVPSLFGSFCHPNAEVRKAVVFALVDLYFLLGEEFTPYLSQLSSTQYKLVQIYCKRRQGSENLRMDRISAN